MWMSRGRCWGRIGCLLGEWLLLSLYAGRYAYSILIGSMAHSADLSP